jgi:EAL domain-containing protein (putative c-di-GMP-specific phosphodiesterase class I)/CheY-like chemotaxis protein
VERIRVLVAEDEETVLDVLSVLLASDPTIDLVATARDAEHAIELAANERPDVALLDVRMPGGGGQRAAREITRRSPATSILAVSAHEDVDTILGMLRAGATGYVVKDEPTGEILSAIRRCVDGKASFSPRVAPEVASALTEVMDRKDASTRTRRKEERIRRVLETRGVSIVYQPIVDLDAGSIAGAEALARFATPPRRSPDVWFAEAEAVGLLRELELQAVAVAVSGLPKLPPPTFLSVNVSPTTAASEELRDLVRRVQATRLVVELTEHAPVDDYDALNEALADLRAEGVQIAIDDSGAGVSSLRHVVSLAPDIVKLDRTLCRGIDADPVRQSLVSALVAFGVQLQTALVAEGIETDAELETIYRLGIRFAQGYLLARPEPIPDDPEGWRSVALKRRRPVAD